MYLEIHKNFPKVYKRKWHSTAGRRWRRSKEASQQNEFRTFSHNKFRNLASTGKNLNGRGEVEKKNRGKAKFRKKFIFAYTKGFIFFFYFLVGEGEVTIK